VAQATGADDGAARQGRESVEVRVPFQFPHGRYRSVRRVCCGGGRSVLSKGE